MATKIVHAPEASPPATIGEDCWGASLAAIDRVTRFFGLAMVVFWPSQFPDRVVRLLACSPRGAGCNSGTQTKGSTYRLPRGTARVGLVAASALVAGIAGVLGLLLFWSYPGRPKPFVDDFGTPLPGSLSEKIFIDVNGVKQGLIVESKDTSHPVLLYLHGGLPDYFLSKQYPTGFEDLSTVAWWEQRGAGLSYSPEIARESLTSEQFS